MVIEIEVQNDQNKTEVWSFHNPDADAYDPNEKGASEEWRTPFEQLMIDWGTRKNPNEPKSVLKKFCVYISFTFADLRTTFAERSRWGKNNVLETVMLVEQIGLILVGMLAKPLGEVGSSILLILLALGTTISCGSEYYKSLKQIWATVKGTLIVELIAKLSAKVKDKMQDKVNTMAENARNNLDDETEARHGELTLSQAGSDIDGGANAPESAATTEPEKAEAAPSAKAKKKESSAKVAARAAAKLALEKAGGPEEALEAAAKAAKEDMPQISTQDIANLLAELAAEEALQQAQEKAEEAAEAAEEDAVEGATDKLVKLTERALARAGINLSDEQRKALQECTKVAVKEAKELAKEKLQEAAQSDEAREAMQKLQSNGMPDDLQGIELHVASKAGIMQHKSVLVPMDPKGCFACVPAVDKQDSLQIKLSEEISKLNSQEGDQAMWIREAIKVVKDEFMALAGEAMDNKDEIKSVVDVTSDMAKNKKSFCEHFKEQVTERASELGWDLLIGVWSPTKAFMKFYLFTLPTLMLLLVVWVPSISITYGMAVTLGCIDSPEPEESLPPANNNNNPYYADCADIDGGCAEYSHQCQMDPADPSLVPPYDHYNCPVTCGTC